MPEIETKTSEITGSRVMLTNRKIVERKFAGYNELKPFLRKVEEVVFPSLAKDLRRADMDAEPTYFIMSTGFTSIIASALIWITIVVLGPMVKLPLIYTLLSFPIVFVLIFFWLMQMPKMKMKKKEKDLDRDVLFAGRDMVISLKAGLPLFNAMANVSKNYGIASVEFQKIVERIESGVPADVALQEASEVNSSRRFHQILFQIIAALRSGSDIATGLEVLLDQISREQVIALKRYGQQLNPITMFYLLFGVILPSIGITVAIILTSFIPFTLDSSKLIAILVLLGLLQVMFLSITQSSRPNFEA